MQLCFTGKNKTIGSLGDVISLGRNLDTDFFVLFARDKTASEYRFRELNENKIQLKC